ncbi:GTPase ObgE [Candidatus Berkelbacteria bacterium]|nr:GTPase ObgE [Candidatus Berkelbacteria bacterium]
MFVDEAQIEVVAGRGGDGSASFRREKFIPKGGPDGGDGGDGGHVYLRVKETSHGLAGLVGQAVFRAEPGEPGRGKQQFGAKGKSLVIHVPPGTVVYQVQRTGDRRQEAESRETLIVDLATIDPGQSVQVARGGRGGLGNLHFASATNQTPRQCTPGTPGEQKRLRLEVRHIADVGLVGLPNVGKSTLLRRLSHAKPRVANYPFTTLEPHLGVVEFAGTRFVLADIPGLIAGAARGKGLGHQFLRHLRRTKVLLHLIDAQSPDPLADYQTIRAELVAYDATLVTRPEVIALSRIDTLDNHTQQTRLDELSTQLGPVYPLSAESGQGVETVVRALLTHLH